MTFTSEIRDKLMAEAEKFMRWRVCACGFKKIEYFAEVRCRFCGERGRTSEYGPDGKFYLEK